MAKKNKNKNTGTEFPTDRIPSDDELDALLDKIEAAKEADKDEASDEASSDDSSDENSGSEGPSPEERTAQLEMEMANLKDQALRAMAEADNVKKRAEREVAAAKL